MILKLLNTRGNMTFIPKEATQEKENFKMQTEKDKKKQKQKNIKKEND